MTALSCSVCGSSGPASADTDPSVWLRCGSCDSLVFRNGAGPLVLVAHDSEEISAEIGAVLLSGGFAAMRAADGAQAMKILSGHRPRAAVVDVALADVMSFQIVDHVRRTPELRQIRVILVASVFNRTAYKRKPVSLYGADDYVEQHHIPDLLPVKLRKHLGLAPQSAPADVEQSVRSIAEASAVALADGTLAEARDVARGIVADIALYHQLEIEAAASGGSLDGLERVLVEGRKLLAERVDSSVHQDHDPIREAFEVLLSTVRRGER